VTGDARFDQVCRRLEAAPPSPTVALLEDASVPTVVAGSTWPADEALLIPAFLRLRKERPVRLIIAPHEPDDAHLSRLEGALSAEGMAHARLGAIEQAPRALPDVVVVDRVGVLADLYRVARAAYVGGGFGDDGLHSVIEPAALGVPVTFGPRHGNAVEAGQLADEGGAFQVTDAASLADALGRLLGAHGETAGSAAREFVERRRGGAARNAALIDDLLSIGERPGRRRASAAPAG
jgi:3-deoxy-D-manno-octulosonic-acid transferase